MVVLVFIALVQSVQDIGKIKMDKQEDGKKNGLNHRGSFLPAKEMQLPFSGALHSLANLVAKNGGPLIVLLFDGLFELLLQLVN